MSIFGKKQNRATEIIVTQDGEAFDRLRKIEFRELRIDDKTKVLYIYDNPEPGVNRGNNSFDKLTAVLAEKNRVRVAKEAEEYRIEEELRQADRLSNNRNSAGLPPKNMVSGEIEKEKKETGHSIPAPKKNPEKPFNFDEND